MVGSNHAAFGLSCGVFVGALLGAPADYVALGAATALWGSLLPDLDQPNSYISSLLPVPGWVVDKLTTHRGLTHQTELVVLACLGALAAASLWGAVFPLFFMVGYASHLVGDGITRGGIPTVWGKLYLLPRGFLIRVGTWTETVVCYTLCFLLFLMSMTLMGWFSLLQNIWWTTELYLR